jgi:PAS domain S-box-containing protein
MRLLLCGVIVATVYVERVAISKQLLAIVALYICFNLAFAVGYSRKLGFKRVRVVPDLADIVFISALLVCVPASRDQWTLLYVFPVMSSSRYLGSRGPFWLAWSSVAGRFLVESYEHFRNGEDLYRVILWALVLLGVGLVAGNLAKARSLEERRLISVFERANAAILANEETGQVLRLILQSSMDFTGSDNGEMILVEQGHGVPGTGRVTAVGTSGPEVTALTDHYASRVTESGQPLFLRIIRRQDLAAAGLVPGSSKYAPRSALFVPLKLGDSVLGAIALYSRRRVHFTMSESGRLESFGALVAAAQEHAGLLSKRLLASEEKSRRLRLLFQIGEQLRIEQGLPALFREVVDLTYGCLESEEAALFIPDPAEPDVIKKVAARGPSDEITRRLMCVETIYRIGASWAGRIFDRGEAISTNCVPPDTEHVGDYSECLPSKTVLHYIGVPLIIGEEVLGVIRVINKRARGYSWEEQQPVLSERGFADEDEESLKVIATQVGFAIKNAKLIEAGTLFKNLVEHSPDPIIVLDEVGRILVFNKACEEIWGVRSEDATGKPVAEFYESPEHAREIKSRLWKAESHRIQDFEARIKTSEQGLVPISLSASLLLDEQGKETGSIGVFKDLRELKRLQQAEKLAAIGRVAHTIGHDIKHNIGAALNYVDVLSFESDDDEKAEIYANVQGELRLGVEKLQDMLTAAKPEAPQMKALGVNSLLRNIEAQLVQEAKSWRIDFVTGYPAAEPMVSVDPDQIRAVLANLFSNSVHAIQERIGRDTRREKGNIELTVKSGEENLFLQWKDNGCGIPTESLDAIFAPFFSSKATGNGLGLFIVKSMIERHGGSIAVSSVVGAGTEFVITLPLFHNSAAAES